MDTNKSVNARPGGHGAQFVDPPALLRLFGAGTATYLSYWTLFFALQRAFNGSRHAH
ncbi:MAG: hypothetical protein QNJ91_03655 [Gammaproteobacteria bacterium]|nr:hypothetical protein [Gammaproteobacteria bacterium]